MIGADFHRYLLVRHYALNCYVRCLNEAACAAKRQVRSACCEERWGSTHGALLKDVQDALGDFGDGANEPPQGNARQDIERIEDSVPLNDTPREFYEPNEGAISVGGHRTCIAKAMIAITIDMLNDDDLLKQAQAEMGRAHRRCAASVCDPAAGGTALRIQKQNDSDDAGR